MRYIDTSGIVVPIDWVSLAKVKLGRTYPSLWSYFKEEFEEIAGKKCWFSEDVNSGAVNPIDHFRPQGKTIRELNKSLAHLEDSIWAQIDNKSRRGYSYLTYEFSNYRYGCDFVNSFHTNGDETRGKSNLFPLKVNSPKGSSRINIKKEIICLLDPCSEGDVQYLTYNSLGFPEPHVSLLNTSWEYCRVKVSIEIYHLNYDRFRIRRLELWNESKSDIELATALIKKGLHFTDDDVMRTVARYIGALKNRIKKTSEFSAVTIDCILYYKKIEENGVKPYDWLEEFFPNKILRK